MSPSGGHDCQIRYPLTAAGSAANIAAEISLLNNNIKKCEIATTPRIAPGMPNLIARDLKYAGGIGGLGGSTRNAKPEML
jgi:hypothetical protein